MKHSKTSSSDLNSNSPDHDPKSPKQIQPKDPLENPQLNEVEPIGPPPESSENAQTKKYDPSSDEWPSVSWP